jgi:hypothetical protein
VGILWVYQIKEKEKTMDITNQGTISLNKPLTQEALDAILSVDEEFVEKTVLEVGDTDIYIEDFPDSEFDGTMNVIIDAISPLGYVLNGEVDYWGDYDGKTFITDNKAESVDVQGLWEYELADEDIIKALEKRGYTVTKTA